MAEVKEGRGGLKKVILKNDEATAEIYLYGAHVTSWRVGGEELLFLSKEAIFKPPKAIRGGIPVCWPQFSDFGALSSHGFARNSLFELRDSSVDSATLVLRAGEGTPRSFPHAFELRIQVSLRGAALVQEVAVANEGQAALEFTAALHSYFRVADIHRARVEGLGEGQQPYLDNLEGRARKESTGPLSFDKEVDRIYLSASPDITVVDGGIGRSVTVSRSGFPDAVVWNPWEAKAKATGDFGDDEYKEMLCVEAAVAPAGAVTVKGGASWSASQTLSYAASWVATAFSSH